MLNYNHRQGNNKFSEPTAKYSAVVKQIRTNLAEVTKIPTRKSRKNQNLLKIKTLKNGGNDNDDKHTD